MRMTRAALRAQEAEDDLNTQIEGKLREQGVFLQNDNSSAEPLIHEDDDEDRQHRPEPTSDSTEDGRIVLRDITSENYPIASADSTPTIGTEESEVKVGKKAKSKGAKKTTNTKKDAITKREQDHTINASAEEQLQEDSKVANETLSSEDLSTHMESTTELESSDKEFSQDSTREIATESIGLGLQDISANAAGGHHAGVSEICHKDTPITPSKKTENVSKTPRFNPEVHLSAKENSDIQSDSTEDSFVESIKTRSPSKLSQTAVELPKEEHCSISPKATASQTPPRRFSPSKSQSPQRIEDSVEAIDALEEAIEKFAEDLPVIEALPFESPVRARKTPSRTPLKAATKTPARTPGQTSVKPPSKTPAMTTSRTPAKSVIKPTTPKVRTPSIEKTQSSTPSSLKEKMASTKRETVKERVKALEAAPVTAPYRRATSVSVLKKEVPVVRQTLKSKHMATKSVPAIATISTTSMSFSNSPVKQNANEPKKRVTSGGVLSTSKPGFVPAKSTKPITTSTFTLPGEAISAKLKAQREERLKREEAEAEKKAAFKAKPAPPRTARPSVMPRENRASVARMNVRQVSGENKENVEPVKSTSTVGAVKSTSTTSKSNATANSSVRRTTTRPTPASTVASRKSVAPSSTTVGPSSQRITSLTSGQQVNLTKAEAVQQKMKGKEGYGRIKGSVQQQDDERKAKEEAAKKARAEAAERGRQASREWAEKQKKKLTVGKPAAAAVEAAS